MKKTKTYKIYDFSDFLKIPIDKLPDALSQFAVMIIKTKVVHDSFQERNIKGGKIRPPLIFKDDGKGETKLKITTTEE